MPAWTYAPPALTDTNVASYADSLTAVPNLIIPKWRSSIKPYTQIPPSTQMSALGTTRFNSTRKGQEPVLQHSHQAHSTFRSSDSKYSPSLWQVFQCRCYEILYRESTFSNEGSFTDPPASPRPATGRLYDQPANCCCIVCDSIGPSTYESVGASEVNSRSKLAVSLAST